LHSLPPEKLPNISYYRLLGNFGKCTIPHSVVIYQF
jgi:hypothetical protein